jgi:putative salt-induced outer membrane protein
MRTSWIWTTAALVTAAPANALAQTDEVAAGIASRDAATGGSTDVAHEGFESATVAPEDAKNATELGVSLGGLASSGNSRSMAVTSAGKLRLRRQDNQFSSGAAINFARSAAEDAEPMETTVENYQARMRYDRFLGKGVAAFLAASARRDRFQGLDLRFNLDPGFAYYFLDDDQTQLWSELGYDLQYDVRTDEVLDAAAAEGNELSSTRLRHSGRLYVGYEASLNEIVSIGTGIEYLQGVPETRFWRLNWDGGVSSSISGRFSIATTVSVKYDHTPLPGVETTDVTTAVSLVYQLL